MKIIIADKAGFCGGVGRAVRLAEEALSQHPEVGALGTLIHNPQMVQKLSEKGMQDFSDSVPDHRVVVVSKSHGLCKETRETLQNAGHTVIETTCPVLVKMYKDIEREFDAGSVIVIVGDPEHPEIQALNSHADYQGIVVSDEKEAEKISGRSNLYVISQTTNRKDRFLAVVEALKKNNSNVRAENTICDATRLRQEACSKLAKEVDAMLVIGGKNSSNTQKLGQVASKDCQNVYVIESESELQADWFQEVKKLGVTAGASTPDFVIQKVVEQAKRLSDSIDEKNG